MSITLKQVADYQEVAQKQTINMFGVAVTEFFKAVPSLKFVTFKVYAPSFNDGDPCLPRFQSEIGYCFVDQEVIDEEYDGMSYIDEMAFAFTLDTWRNSNVSVADVKKAFQDMVDSHGDDENDEGEPRVDFSAVTDAQLEAIAEFHSGLLAVGYDFFYNQGEDGQYVLSATGMEVLEVEIDY